MARFVVGLLVALSALLAIPVSAFGAPFTVDTTAVDDDGSCGAPSGDCTLLEAINAANAATDLDTIGFSITGAGPHVISPTAELPALTGPTVVDGTTEPSFNPLDLVPVVVIDGSALSGANDGLIFATSTGTSTARGLAINDFGSGAGINVEGGPAVIEGNRIGTDPAGTTEEGNAAGVFVADGETATIGGDIAAERNVISGNSGNVSLGASGTGPGGSVITGNYIGTNAAGTASLVPFFGIGIAVATDSNQIGGSAGGQGNLISGLSTGIELNGHNNQVMGNLIGTNAAGTGAVPSARGFSVPSPGATGNVIGGTDPGEGNTISGNSGYGLQITTNTGLSIQGNRIGITASGDAPLPNDTGLVVQDATNIEVGGASTAAGNTIAHNTTDGVQIIGTSLARVRSNQIHSNGDLGIDLGDDGLTSNDAGDVDAGPNDLLNFPLISTATTSSAGTSVSGTYNGPAITTVTIEAFSSSACDPSGNGEGQTSLGTTSVVTDGSGNASFTVTSAASVAVGQPITATASTASPNPATSEFSACVSAAQGQEPLPPGPIGGPGTEQAGGKGGDRSGLSEAQKAQLARTYVPRFIFDQDESWWPMSIAGFINNSELKFISRPRVRKRRFGHRRVKCDSRKVRRGDIDHAKLGGLRPNYTAKKRSAKGVPGHGWECRDPAGRDFNADEFTRPFSTPPTRAHGLKKHYGFALNLSNSRRHSIRPHSNTPVYWEHGYRSDNGHWIRYYLMYGCSGVAVPRFIPHYNDECWHEGEWEGLTIFFGRNLSDGPEEVFFNQHHNGTRVVNWFNTLRTGNHVRAYVATNTHATYQFPGEHTTRGPGVLPKFGRDYADGAGPEWTPQSIVNARIQPWYGYGGAWGDMGTNPDHTGPAGPGHNIKSGGFPSPWVWDPAAFPSHYDKWCHWFWYPKECIRPKEKKWMDLDCPNLPKSIKPIKVNIVRDRGGNPVPDPHNFDGDHDGKGCEKT